MAKAFATAVLLVAIFYAFAWLGMAVYHDPETMTTTPPPARHLEHRSEGMTVAQAAEKLGVHAQTIRNWINAGNLPITRFGPGRGLIYIHPEDLDEYGGPQGGQEDAQP